MKIAKTITVDSEMVQDEQFWPKLVKKYGGLSQFVTKKLQDERKKMTK
jgi:hypothetical protein